MKRMKLGATLLMLSSLCLFAACAGNGCNSIFPEKKSAYTVSRIESEGGDAIRIVFPYKVAEFQKYLDSISGEAANEVFSFFVRDVSTKKKVSAACSHEMVGEVFQGNCIAQDGVFVSSTAVELIAERKEYTEEQVKDQTDKWTKIFIVCMHNMDSGGCPQLDTQQKIEAEYQKVEQSWHGGADCADSVDDGLKPVCDGLKEMGCDELATRDECYEWFKPSLELAFATTDEVHKSPKLSLETAKTVSADCAFGSDDPSCSELAPDCEQDPTAEGCGDAGDGQGDDLQTEFEDKGDVGDDGGDSGGEDMAPGSAGDCALMPHAAVDPLVFLLLGGALLPLVGRRRGGS